MLTYVYLVLCINFVLVLTKNEEYMGHRVYNVKFTSQEQQEKFHVLKSDSVDYWRKPSLKYGVVGQAMVPPSHFDWFEGSLQDIGVERDVLIEDVYEYLLEVEHKLTRNSLNVTDVNFDFQGYYRYNDILNYMNSLNEMYSNSTTVSFELVEFGQTEQNKPLVYIKLTNRNQTEKPVIIIEANIIPREWVTIPAALYVVHELLDVNVTRYLDEFEWIVIPVLNPDGYEYTHTNLRLWTKSMSTKSQLGFICPGVNINRNFDIDWSISDSSSSPCSHLYAGISPLSEIESQLVSSIIEQYKNRLKMYISLQNTGGFISYPWQYEKAASGMFRHHLLLGLEMVSAMNDTYNLDVASIAYGDRASGSSTDYARNNDVLYTFNVDIVQRGNDGVNVPEGDILYIAEDVWRAVSVAAVGML